MWVAGVDGCPKGWLVVFRSTLGEHPRAELFEKFADVVATKPAIIAVDVPIGLPILSEQGGRKADREARKKLGRFRQSSVFPSPSRRTLEATSYLEACKIEQRNSRPSKKVSQQVYNIFDKIREVDFFARDRSIPLFECHPEVSFWAMNNKTSMQLAKKRSRQLPSGLIETGLQERCEVLTRNGYTESFVTTRIGTALEHSRDDLIDACAAAWTAERIHTKGGGLARIPEKEDLDSYGIDMAIWA